MFILPALQKSQVSFDRNNHRYFLDGKELHGITSTLVERAFPNEYEGVDENDLERARQHGTAVHKAIEDYENEFIIDDSPELSAYVRLKDEYGLTQIASEYLVSDNEYYASPIDIVACDSEGRIILIDIKTTYKPYYEKTALQLSIYKRFFEKQNPDLSVHAVAIMWLRPNKAEFRLLPVWAEEALDSLIDADMHGKPFDITTTYGNLPAEFAKVEDSLAAMKILIEQNERQYKALQEKLYNLMEEKGVKSFTGQKIQLTRVLPQISKKFDLDRFREENPELYQKYLSVSTRKGSLRITIPKKK